jgi:hypothetical protein
MVAARQRTPMKLDAVAGMLGTACRHVHPRAALR